MSDLSLHDVDDANNNNNSSTSGGGGGPNSSSNGSGAGSGTGNREMTKAELEVVAFEALEKAYVSLLNFLPTLGICELEERPAPGGLKLKSKH